MHPGNLSPPVTLNQGADVEIMHGEMETDPDYSNVPNSIDCRQIKMKNGDKDINSTPCCE